MGPVQNHKRRSTLIQRIPFRSSSQVNVDTVQIPFSHHVDGPEKRPVEHEAKPNQRKPAPGLTMSHDPTGILDDAGVGANGACRRQDGRRQGRMTFLVSRCSRLSGNEEYCITV